MTEQTSWHPDELPADPMDEQLTAYLDGELDAESTRQLEERLAVEPALRKRLTELQAAWDLLEDLPASEADASFTYTTVSMVALRANEETQRHRWGTPMLWGAVAGVFILAAAGLGYWAVDYVVTAPERQFARDLSVIERMDMYRAAESVEFLRKLSDEGLFDEETPHSR